ncbi:hypothetical protein BCR35DRAFT_335356 [Leucosporidium creatinivorum]|uniref:Uncharacterized protein n=1 Tax=Leucosporidium creatinivorum TaxID=106004 RepID=A0A1Y2DDC9_9BASI|nr:hypothetical protein BCR35DRAFT_335356 [Leucosporidium creatinivorum]
MARACQARPSNASAVVWLGYEHWNELDPYAKARVVLDAKAYAEMIRSVYEQRVGDGTLPASSSPAEVSRFVLHESVLVI